METLRESAAHRENFFLKNSQDPESLTGYDIRKVLEGLSLQTVLIKKEKIPLSCDKINSGPPVGPLPALSLMQRLTHPSEPGLEGVLSDDKEDTEATDRGRDEDGIVKDRTMDRGRLPRLSSRLEG